MRERVTCYQYLRLCLCCLLLGDLVDRGQYRVIGCDITALERLGVELMRGGVDHTLPTLLLAEVVLTYIKPEQ